MAAQGVVTLAGLDNNTQPLRQHRENVTATCSSQEAKADVGMD
jgi:hypothetical protein